MSLLYSAPSFKYSEAELKKNQELMDFNHHHYLQQNQHNSGMARYRSVPSSVFESLVTDSSDHHGGDGRIGCEDYRYFRSSSPEMDTMLAKFMPPCDVLGDSNSHELQAYGESLAIKQEVADSELAYQCLSGHDSANVNTVSVGNSVENSTFGGMNSLSLENSSQARKMSSPNGANLIRQTSSPPGLFSNLCVDNGFAGFGVFNGTNRDTGPSTSRLSSHVNFSSGPSVLPRIAEVGDENIGTRSHDHVAKKRQYMTRFANGSWDDASLNGFKRRRDNNGHAFTSLSTFNDQFVNSENCSTGLTHHLSLPKTATEMAAIEKYLQSQSSVPCKIRAKRGCATHPRSIAERVRRTRISERMKKLQDLFPNMDKQTNTADMLDLAVEYIKDLQKQVKTLSDTKAKCECSSKQRQFSNSSA